MEYGFFTQEYIDGTELQTFGVGDGKSLFCPLSFDGRKCVGLGLQYGKGAGVGVDVETEPETLAVDFGVGFQILFDNPDSIDAMIRTLERCKEELIDKMLTDGED